MRLFKTTYKYIISCEKLKRLIKKSKNDLSKTFIPVNIGKVGNQKIETSIYWVKTEDNNIKLTITSSVEKLNLGTIIGIILLTLFTGFLYSVTISLCLFIFVFFPIILISISMTKARVRDQTIEYLKKI